MGGIAYFAPGVRAETMLTAHDVPAFERVLPAGPWQCMPWTHPQAGRGVVIYWEPADLTERPGTWRQCPDGLWYRSPATLPSQAALAKRSAPRGIDITTSTGAFITIPLAAAAPRKVSLSLGAASDPASRFGVMAHQVFDRLAKGAISVLDPDVLALVTQALMEAYRVTPELVDDLGWITTADIDPILCAILGADPKASDPAGGSSPLPAGA